MPYALPKWDKFDDELIHGVHGELQFYRDLYYGDHHKLFARAKELVEQGEITDNIFSGMTKNPQGNIRTPYIIANASKVVVNVPSILVSRAVGNLAMDEDQEFEREDTEAFPDGKEYLSDVLEDIERQSGFKRGTHKQNIIHMQMDGGIVGIPVKDDNGVRIDFKKREVYFPHDDELGCDLVFKRKLEDLQGEMKEYVHVMRHRVEDGSLTITETLHELLSGNLTKIEDDEAAQILEVDSLVTEFPGRSKPLVCYLANEPTFDYPLGLSTLKGQATKQDEINWTFTRSSIVFERNGKPRIAVSKEVMSALQQKALERYGDPSKIDARDFEVMTIDKDGKAMEIYQIDVSKIGDVDYIKNLMKMMFIETNTSEKAVDFYLQEGSVAQSGVAKFYDLFTSIVKAEEILDQYVDFIQELVENCFWLMAQDAEYADIEIIRPSITIKDMIPTSSGEVIDRELKATGNKPLRSVEKAVKAVNPHMSDDAIEKELEAIEEDAQSTNSNTGAGVSMTNMSALMDNRNPDGTPIEQQGQDTAEEQSAAASTEE